MKVSQYVKENTLGRGICFSDFLHEVWELITELVRLNRAGVQEEQLSSLGVSREKAEEAFRVIVLEKIK